MNPCDSFFFFPKHLKVSVKVRDGILSCFWKESLSSSKLVVLYLGCYKYVACAQTSGKSVDKMWPPLSGTLRNLP